MYRGMLFAQLGDLARARADHARLLALDAGLAARLDAVIAGHPTDEGYEGLTPQYE
jgi:hypothetical protein